MKKFQSAEEKGITLIALIITIIVLLILAGITIELVVGDNGILKQSKTAKAKTEIKQAVEQAQIDIAGKVTANLGNAPTDEQVKEVLNEYFYNVPEDLTDRNQELETKPNRYKVKLSEILENTTLGNYDPNDNNNNINDNNTDPDGDDLGIDFTTSLTDWQMFYSDESSIIQLIYKGYLHNDYLYIPDDSGIALGDYSEYCVGTSSEVEEALKNRVLVEWLITSNNWRHIAKGVRKAITEENAYSSVKNIYENATITATGGPLMKDMERSYQTVKSGFKIGYYKDGRVYENYTQDGASVEPIGEGTECLIYPHNVTSSSGYTPTGDGFAFYDPDSGVWHSWKYYLYGNSDSKWVINSNEIAYGYWLCGRDFLSNYNCCVTYTRRCST